MRTSFQMTCWLSHYKPRSYQSRGALILSKQALRKRSAPTEDDTTDSVGTNEENQVEEEAVDSHSTDHPVLRSVRTRNPPIRYGLTYTHASVTGIQEPRGYSEAVSGPEKEQWLAAMALEVK